MDTINVPYKVRTQIATFQGEWTAEQIDNGEAGEPELQIVEVWYEPTEAGPVVVTDPQRLAELEASIKNDDVT